MDTIITITYTRCLFNSEYTKKISVSVLDKACRTISNHESCESIFAIDDWNKEVETTKNDPLYEETFHFLGDTMEFYTFTYFVE